MLKNFCLTLFLLNEQIHTHTHKHTRTQLEVLGERIKKCVKGALPSAEENKY